MEMLQQDAGIVAKAELAGGQRLELFAANGDDYVVVHASSGSVSVSVTIQVTEQGLTLHLGADHVHLRSEGTVSIDAEELNLIGRSSVALRGGDVTVTAEGDLQTEGRAQQIRSRVGDVSLRANDDVKLWGERVRVNC